ncbi:MAG: c-type cytochrome [Pseudomonadota bacterium]
MTNDRFFRVALCCAVIASVIGGRSAGAQETAAGHPERFGFGHPATEAEIAAWDRDIRPNGDGLPAGSGQAGDGEAIYAAKCAVCHGATGVEGPNDRLVRGPDEGFPRGDDPNSWQHRTIGNYWPYATTVFDYIWRSMPQNVPGSLTADEVYALTAFLLWRNGIIGEGEQLDANNLADIVMPARDEFKADDRLGHSGVH